MLKILHVLNHAGKGGTEKYVYTLAEAFKKLGAKSYFAYNEEGSLIDELKSLNIESFKLDMKHPFDLSAARKLAQLCKQLDISVIHTHFLRENYIAILSRIFNPRVKVVYTNHVIIENNFSQKVTNRIFTPFNQAIIAISRKSKEVLIKNAVDEKKIHLIHHGLDPLPEIECQSSIRQELGIEENVFVLLSISRFSKEKGLDFLVLSLNELQKSQIADFKCLMVGDGPLFNDIKELIREVNLEKHIILTGYRTDIQNIIKGSDLFINASEQEALGLAILEALAVGIPVVATNVGGVSDIVTDETQCGKLVEYGDTVSLAKAISEMVQNKEKYNYYRQNAKFTIERYFSKKIMIDKTLKTYL